jgi:uncharacterized protein with gpF-like domain
MFNSNKINRVKILLDIDDITIIESAIKRQAKYLGISSTLLLNSYIVIVESKKEYISKKEDIKKYKTKNLSIAKYKESIVDLYKSGMGYLKISIS